MGKWSMLPASRLKGSKGSRAYQELAPKVPKSKDKNRVRICFAWRELGKCPREEAGEKCNFFHLDLAKVVEGTHPEYVASGKCPDEWNCKNKHPKSRRTRAMKGTKPTGFMLREADYAEALAWEVYS